MPIVTVFGTVFVDVKGFAKDMYHALTRNLGKIQFVHGGVGRNVAENLGKLNLNTLFVSSVESSGLGKEVIDRLQNSNVNTKYVIETNDQGMGMWLAILDEKGDLAGSISQMPNLVVLKEAIIKHGSDIVNESSHVVLELDLNYEIVSSILFMAKTKGIPVYGIPGNLEVILNHKQLLKELECFICNNFEADLFLEQDFSNLDIKQKQLILKEYVDKMSMKSMVVTLGEQGSVYYDCRTQELGYQPAFPVNIVDSSGAGDAFFSGTVMGLVIGLALREAVVYGTKVAAWTIESEENNCLDLREKIQNDELFSITNFILNTF